MLEILKTKLTSKKLWVGLILIVIGIVLCASGDINNGMNLITIGGVSYLGAEAIVDVIRSIFIQESEGDQDGKDE